MDDYPAGFDDLRVRFVFVPDGAPVPWDWMADWTDIVRVPATLVLRHAAKDAEEEEHLRDADYAAPITSAASPRLPAFPESRPAQLQYRSYAPRAFERRGRKSPGGSIEVAALGDLRCEGFPGDAPGVAAMA